MEGEAANLATAAQQQAAGLTHAAQESAEAVQHKAAGLVGSALASAQASWGGRVCGWCAAGQAGKSKAWLGRLAQQHQVFKSLLHLMACCIAT